MTQPSRLSLRVSSMLSRCFVWGLAWWVMALASGPTLAEPYVLVDASSGPLGQHVRYLVEEGPQPLTWQQALANTTFREGSRAVAAHGIGAPPVWMRLEVHNPAGATQAVSLLLGETWIDELDVVLVQGGRALQSWRTGDATENAEGMVPGIGFVFGLQFPPGSSELLVRAHTSDPLVLPIELMPQRQLARFERQVHYYYGLLYGALLALAFVNALLYTGRRAQAHLVYALYLLAFIAMNMGYTGHALAWLWPGRPELQRFLIYVLMVLFSCSGLGFASRFLELPSYAPRLQRAVVGVSLAVVMGMATLVALRQQVGAGLLAFGFMTVFTLSMAGLGLLAVRDGRTAGRHFLAAVGFGMAGAAVTTLCVWGVLPVNVFTYHAVEVGVLLEALLLAQALAIRMRHEEQARTVAERQARQDALTGLLNRRGFLESAAGPWSTAARSGRPLAVVMLDIDHFKLINDEHGHAAGDLALVAVAHRLMRDCRAGDIVARWGGEEFVLLLPETDLEQACALADRIRVLLAQDPVVCQGVSLSLRASFGVAQHGQQHSLEALIDEADHCLYDAKRRGRNRVSSGMPVGDVASG